MKVNDTVVKLKYINVGKSIEIKLKDKLPELNHKPLIYLVDSLLLTHAIVGDYEYDESNLVIKVNN